MQREAFAFFCEDSVQYVSNFLIHLFPRCECGSDMIE